MARTPQLDELGQFLDAAHNNEKAFGQDLPVEYRRFRDIDALFARILNNLDNPPHLAPTFFFYRCHSALRASMRLVMSGESLETYVTLRVALEYALYGVYFWKHPEDWDMWCARQESDGTRKAVRDKFRPRLLFATAETADHKNALAAHSLYERCIDLGAHPNPTGVWGAVNIAETEETFHIDVSYLSARNEPHSLAVRTTCQVGLCSFALLGAVFAERVALLGLWDVHGQLKKGF